MAGTFGGAVLVVGFGLLAEIWNEAQLIACRLISLQHRAILWTSDRVGALSQRMSSLIDNILGGQPRNSFTTTDRYQTDDKRFRHGQPSLALVAVDHTISLQHDPLGYIRDARDPRTYHLETPQSG